MRAGQRPTVALTCGDPAGIGPELVAKLLAREDVTGQAGVVLVGDRWVWEEGQRVAGAHTPLREIRSLEEASGRADGEPGRWLLPVETVQPHEVRRGTVSAAAGASVLRALRRCLDAARAGHVDAICFAPLNKLAMKQAGLAFPDELHFFADYLGVRGFVCELNVLDGLWTTRVTSHIPLKDVPAAVSSPRIKDAGRLLYRALRAAGVERPRIAVAGLNPHAGEGGTCGREEIEIIEPAVREVRDDGVPMEGPFPADTIFRRALAGLYDGILTMYHDQGQIAMKLMGFEPGVTVQGGLPIPITTPAHGTAFDIAGQNKADVEALSRAFALACRMAASHR
jgi:4-hydroxythreonine-4-phosphate dehydrogenase